MLEQHRFFSGHFSALTAVADEGIKGELDKTQLDSCQMQDNEECGLIDNITN